jgi:hypothetical protein
MKSEFRLFGLLSGFLYLAAIVYAFWTRAEGHGVEWIGTVALVLSGLLTGMCTVYFFFVSRRIDERPEDRPDAEMSDGAGEVGFFSPGSYWPITVAGAATVVGMGLAFAQLWLVIVGALFLLFAIGGLLFEYYVGQNATQS